MIMVNKFCKKIRETSIKALSGIRRSALEDKSFTIISNNCWAGSVYRHYGLPYLSPTIGLYLFADDYITFCSQLEESLGSRLHFINVEESKHREELKARHQQNIPLGILNNGVEIVFLHYRSWEEACEKWNRRVERVKPDNIIIKFSEMNCCTLQHLEAFDNLLFKKKVCFTANEYPHLHSCVPISRVIREGYVADDTSFYDRYIDLTAFINNGSIRCIGD